MEVEREERGKEDVLIKKKINRIMVKLTWTILIIILNISYLNFPVKQQRFSKWIKNHNETTYCVQEVYVKYKDTK